MGDLTFLTPLISILCEIRLRVLHLRSVPFSSQFGSKSDPEQIDKMVQMPHSGGVDFWDTLMVLPRTIAALQILLNRLRARVCVCAREREREIGRKTERQRDRECVCVCVLFCLFAPL